MSKPFILLAALAAAGAAVFRRRQAHADADTLWREATADSSR